MSFKQQIEKIIEIKIEDIKPEETLLQLGLDSIKIVELAGFIEDNTQLLITEDMIFKINGKWIHDFLKKYDK